MFRIFSAVFPGKIKKLPKRSAFFAKHLSSQYEKNNSFRHMFQTSPKFSHILTKVGHFGNTERSIFVEL